MQRIDSFTDMTTGKIYNLIYVGNNAAYAKINGKRTILVTATVPVMQYVQLYDPFPNCCNVTKDLRGTVVTATDPACAFAEDEIFEVTDENEWFKHSRNTTSLSEAIEQAVLTLKDITDCAASSRRDVAVSNERGEHIGRYLCFNVEGKTAYPFLQYVYVWWNSLNAMRADFERYGVSIRK